MFPGSPLSDRKFSHIRHSDEGNRFMMTPIRQITALLYGITALYLWTVLFSIPSFKLLLKAGFHMIANDHRRSRIAEDRKESCFHIIANDRRADCSHTFRSAEMSNVLRVLCSRENQSKQHGGHWGGNFAGTKFISSLSSKATTTSASKPKETSVLGSKNIHEETK